MGPALDAAALRNPPGLTQGFDLQEWVKPIPLAPPHHSLLLGTVPADLLHTP